MKKPQFAERQYEIAAHIELARGGGSPFVPTQSMEAHIGIDAAADPVNAHAIWRILSVHIPRRVTMSPALWPKLPRQFHDEIPGRYCSLFMQFKRPIFQDSRHAKYHGRIGGHYYQVDIVSHQQRALLELHRKVRAKAIVRYASPAFWSRDEFDLYDRQRKVLANSAFISPARIKTHRQWMYGGPLGKVVLNPKPEDAEGESWDAIIANMNKLAVRESLRQHVRSLATNIGDASEAAHGENSWLARIAQYGQFSGEDYAFLADLRVVARAAEFADATWLAMLLPEDDWRRYFQDQSRWNWWPPF